jgi:hypothetical protein
MTRQTIETIAFVAALLIVSLALHAWIASRNEQQRLESTLAAQKKLLDAADARETDRNATLSSALAQIDALKRATQTPEQIVRDLPKYLSLPQPITLVGDSPRGPSQAKPAAPQNNSSANSQQGTGGTEIRLLSEQPSQLGASPSPAQNSLPDAVLAPDSHCETSAGCAAELPPADLKPLYDYVQDCRACQAELAVAKQNSADDAAKIAALTSERDAAITASKGGTVWRRFQRNALWFAIGAAAGAVAGHVASSH